jgi:prepilin-type N-terminal cleavage/methylation domain-containing protein
MRAPNARGSRGFTLIELAVVLLIVVVLLTLGAGVVNLASENSSFSQTRRKQEAVKDALIAYLGKNKRLPCPDLPAAPGNTPGLGDDNRTTAGDPTSPCSVDAGVLPYIELGIPRDFALDGWENFFTYRVTVDAADLSLDWARTPITSFAPGKPGKLDVSMRSPATSAVLTPLTSAPDHAVAVVVSHGKNGLGAWTSQGTRNILPTGADELANANATGVFIQRDVSDVNVSAGPFDDLVIYLRPSDLITPLVRDGSMRSAEGETNFQISIVSDEVVSRYVTTSDSTLPGSVTIRQDGWGKPMVYYSCTSPITISSDPNAIAYRIISGGSNMAVATGGCPATPDPTDVVVDVTVATMKTLYTKAGHILPPP